MMSKSRFTIVARKREGPDQPTGDVTIDYDPDEDILWIGRSLDPAGDEISHADGDILADPRKNVVVTINNEGSQPWFVSSVALTQASRHPLWADIFRGLEFALRERKAVRFSVHPTCWDLK